MFFLFSTPRSGSTLLAQCLSAHSKIIIPNETDFIVPMAMIFDRISDEDAGRQVICNLITSTNRFKSLEEYIKPKTIYEIIHSNEYAPTNILFKLYKEIAQAAGAELAGDKSPNDLGYIRLLIKTGCISPETKIIHLVRDIRDLMISLKSTGWIPKNELISFPKNWSNSNLLLHSHFKNNPNYLLARYEDIVQNPARELALITKFLGYDFEEGMLDPEKRHERYRKIKVHANLYKPISASSINRYRTMLAKTTLKQYETQGKKALKTFGYL